MKVEKKPAIHFLIATVGCPLLYNREIGVRPGRPARPARPGPAVPKRDINVTLQWNMYLKKSDEAETMGIDVTRRAESIPHTPSA